MPPASLPAELAIKPGPKMANQRKIPVGARRKPRKRTLRPLTVMRMLVRTVRGWRKGVDADSASSEESGSRPCGTG
jgi:hypothetical protein